MSVKSSDIHPVSKEVTSDSSLIVQMGSLMSRLAQCIQQVPSQLYQLVMKIVEAVKALFGLSSKIPAPVQVPKPVATSVVHSPLEESGDLGIARLYQEEKQSPHKVTAHKPVELDILKSVAALATVEILDEAKLSSPAMEQAVLKEMKGVAQALVEPAQVLLKQDKLNLSLLKEYHVLEKYLPDLKEMPKTERVIIQKTLQAIKKHFCHHLQKLYKTNSTIKAQGNCLFQSIAHFLGDQKSQQEYRALAVQYLSGKCDLSSHHAKSLENIVQAMTKGQAQMVEYAKEIAGKEFQDKEFTDHVPIWVANLEVKLKRKPKLVDFYFDCMENFNMWGSTLEIEALSKKLQVPILIFTLSTSGKEWRLDVMQGHEEFANKPPILLYDNGGGHYQDLMPK